MRKSEIDKIPIKKQSLNKAVNEYRLYAYIEEVAKEKVLVIDCYFSRNDMPTYRIYMTKDDYITRDVRAEGKQKWRTACIENLLDLCLYRTAAVANTQSEEIIINFFKKHGFKTHGNALEWISCYQEEIRKKRLIERDRRITDPIDKRMEQVPALPDDFETWLYNEALYKSRYIFYVYSRKKPMQGYCSHCKTWVEITEAKHNMPGICPNCESDITFKAMNKQKYISDAIKPVILQKVDNEIIARIFYANRSFNKINNTISPVSINHGIYEKYRIFFDCNGKVKNYYIWDMFKQREVRWCNDGYYLDDPGVLYTNDLDEVLHDTVYKYSAIKQMATKEYGYEFMVIDFLRTYPSNRYYEYLIKYNLCNIVKDLLRSSAKDRYINPYSNNIADLLRIKKHDLSILQAADANITGLEYLRYCRQHNIKPDVEHIRFIQSRFHYELEHITKFLKYTTMGKAIKYLKSLKKVRSIAEGARLWDDYINMCSKLRYDLNNDFILFPKDLKTRHDQCVQLINEKNNRKEQEKANKTYQNIKAMYKATMQKYFFENDKFIILAPKDAGEIIKEGQKLHHCVGTYIEKVSNGLTTILFIREKENPDEPYYTMEVKDGQIIQVRGKYNAAMTPEVNGFVNSFKASKLKLSKVAG